MNGRGRLFWLENFNSQSSQGCLTPTFEGGGLYRSMQHFILFTKRWSVYKWVDIAAPPAHLY